jgi:hypothetical protein
MIKRSHAQLDAMDCGSAALRMICTHCGRNFPRAWLRELREIGKAGVNLLGISEADAQDAPSVRGRLHDVPLAALDPHTWRVSGLGRRTVERSSNSPNFARPNGTTQAPPHALDL